jgi:hypothetical protein
MRSRISQAARLTPLAMAASLCLSLSLAVAEPVRAQVLVVAEQNLQFGMLTPGVPATVPVTDVARRAAFSLDAQGRYNLSFQLPTHLHGARGATIPVVFGATDGRVEIRQKIATFDPAAGVSIHINPAEQQARIYLGGSARPDLATAAGTYSAEIVMLIVFTGT